MFDGYAAENKREWSHDRSLTVGASEQFQCIRKTFFTKHKYPEDSDFVQSYGATSRGSIYEEHLIVPVLRAMKPEGAQLLWAGDEQVTLVKDRISATPDGIMTGLPSTALAEYGVEDIESDSILVEIKTFDPRINLTEPKFVHAGQVQQQLGLVHETTNHRPEYAVILYVNASWVDDVRPFVIKRDPSAYQACKTRADMVYDSTDPKALAPEGKIRGGSECDYCPFQSACALAQVGSVPTERKDSRFTDTEEAELRSIIAKDREARKREASGAEAKAAAAEELKAFLAKHKTKFARTSDGYSISWAVSAGRKSYDYAKIVEDTGIDLDDYVIFGDPSERLTVRAPKV
jgi:hypothetical protein